MNGLKLLAKKVVFIIYTDRLPTLILYLFHNQSIWAFLDKRKSYHQHLKSNKRLLGHVKNLVEIRPKLVHAGQNYDYELNQIFFEDLGIRKPDYFLVAPGANYGTTIGQITINIGPLLEKEQPDAFLVLGDTNSYLCAIPAQKRNIPIFHMGASKRCFEQRVPEESNRKIDDHIADINLCYSDIAREYLLREGLPPDRIIKTGSPIFEVLHHYLQQIDQSDVLNKLKLEKGKYFEYLYKIIG